MMDDIRRQMEAYHAWLKDKSVLRQLGEWVEITTPYLDRHNDYLQIYAQPSDGGYLLTDDGYTINDLEQCGCDLGSRKRQDLLRMTVNGFGVQVEDKALQVQASSENFALRKHNLIQTMLAVNDMFYLAKPRIASLFLEDVTAWLDRCEVRYTPRVKFAGRSGYDYLFHFVIPRSRKSPERIVHAINDPGRQAAQRMAFSWHDTRTDRDPESRAYSFLNDTEGPVSQQVVAAMEHYDIRAVPWSQCDSVREELAA